MSKEPSFEQSLSLEAVVAADGVRPVVHFRSGALDLEAAQLGMWDKITANQRALIEVTAQSVGRLDLGGRPLGSGFLVAEDLVMTNRHVLEQLPRNSASGHLDVLDLTIRFEEGKAAFAVERMVDPHEVTSLKVDPCLEPDCALIKLVRARGQSLPHPLGMEDNRSHVQKNRTVYLIGFPSQPPPGEERFSVLSQLYGMEFGSKTYCPGEISEALGAIAPDKLRTIFAHDCTTLAGCSGAPIVDLGDGSTQVVGIHFGGQKRVNNYAHSLAALRNQYEDLNLNYIY